MYNNQSINPKSQYFQEFIDDRFRKMSSWGHIGYDILFTIPVVGIIMLIIYALDDSYVARRNYARSKFCRLAIVVPIYIIIILLAAIVMNASTSTVSNAQYARFAQEFGEYSDQIKLDSAYVKQSTALKGNAINNAQMYYMAAHGYTSIDDDSDAIKGYSIPVGYDLKIDANNIDEDVLINTLKTLDSSDYIAAYVINDGVITSYTAYTNDSDGSAAREFYGDSNGKEYHFVTSDGDVFTLPGFPSVQSDGTIEYHIDSKSGHYYVVSGNSGKSVGSMNVNGDFVETSRPIQATDLTKTKGILSNGNEVSQMSSNEPKTNIIGK